MSLSVLKRVSVPLLSVLAACACLQTAHGFTLAENGESRSVVIPGPDATPVELHAAEELCHFLSRVTGADIRRSDSPAPGKYSIWLGTPDTNPQISARRLAGRVNELSDHGFLLHADGSGLVIAGREPAGVLYGTYAFLEEHVGMRWFFPGEDGEYRPNKPLLRIGAISDAQNPSFKRRKMGFDSAAVTSRITDTWDWLARNRMQASPVHPMHREEMEKRAMGPAVINLPMGMVPNALFDEHPEYFGLYAGERRKQSWEGYQPCTSHPEVINLSARHIIKWLEENPGGEFNLHNNDWPYFCECPDCKALDPPEEEGLFGGRVSTRWFTFINEVYSRVWEEKPEAKLMTIAYQNFRLPPAGVVPDPRLIVQLCDHRPRCFRHSLDDEGCEVHNFQRDMFEGWAEVDVARSNFTYYNSGFPSPKVVPLEKVVAADMRYHHRLGHVYWYHRTMPPDGSYAHLEQRGRDPEPTRIYWRANMHMHYLQAKLAWDIEADVEALMRDLNEKFYGPAGVAMGRYREKLIALWQEAPGHFLYGHATRPQVGAVLAAPGAVGELTRLLDDAASAADWHGDYSRRVAVERGFFEDVWLASYRAHRDLQQAADTRAARRTAPVRIDGNLDEPDWTSQERISGFVAQGARGALAEHQTYVRILYDDDYLCLGLEMEEPDTDTLAMNTVNRDDANIFLNDDTVEIFIDPEGDGVKYAHIAINPAGVFRDSMVTLASGAGGDAAYDSSARIATRIGEGGWTAEMMIPASALGGAIRDGGGWKINIGRVRRAAGGIQVSSWADGGAFHSPEVFRTVSFARAIIRNGRFAGTVVMDTGALLSRHGAARWEYGNEPPMVPSDWLLNNSLPGKITIVSEDVFSGENAVRIEGERAAIFSFMDAGLKGGDKLSVSFAARGEGKAGLSVYHYGKGWQFEKTTSLGSVTLEPGWNRFEFEYTHPQKEQEVGRQANALAVSVSGGWAVIDDVSAVPAD